MIYIFFYFMFFWLVFTCFLSGNFDFQFFDHTCCLWKFPNQGRNQSHSCAGSHHYGMPDLLTHCAGPRIEPMPLQRPSGYRQILFLCVCVCLFVFCLLLLLLLLLFLGPLPRHMEVPRLGVESEL